MIVIIIIIDNDDSDSDSDSNIFTKDSHHIDWGIRIVFIHFYFLTDGDEPIGKTMSCYIWHFKVGDFGQRSSAFVFHRWEESYKSWLHKNCLRRSERIWTLVLCPMSISVKTFWGHFRLKYEPSSSAPWMLIIFGEIWEPLEPFL